jgi:hypothetical protein
MEVVMIRRVGRIAGSAGLATLALLGLAGGAQAATTADATSLMQTAASTETCTAPVTQRPFAAFGDLRDYVLAPDGSFEAAGLPGWQPSAGATRVTDADPVRLGSQDGAGMLALPQGASIVSPVMCVDLNYPTGRFLAKSVGNAYTSQLRVEVIYPDAPTKPTWEQRAVFGGMLGRSAGSGWRLTPDVNLRPMDGGRTAGMRLVAYRFTATAGDWRIDDVYIDPRCR